MAKGLKKTASRLDPAPRPIDGQLPYFNVQNKDPDREYVWVYKAASDFVIEHYAYQGYVMEQHREGGPCPAMSLSIDDKTGKPIDRNGMVIESRGNVLMSVSKERHQEIYLHGSDGVSGQLAADAQAKRMLDPSKHERDSMRGINPRTKNGDVAFYAESDKGSIASIPVGDEDG